MALDETGATLRSTLELVELKSPSAEPGQSHFTFHATRLGVPLRGRSNGHRALSSPKTDLGPDGNSRTSGDSGNTSVGGSDVSPGSGTGPQTPVDYFGLGMSNLRQ